MGRRRPSKLLLCWLTGLWPSDVLRSEPSEDERRGVCREVARALWLSEMRASFLCERSLADVIDPLEYTEQLTLSQSTCFASAS